MADRDLTRTHRVVVTDPSVPAPARGPAPREPLRQQLAGADAEAAELRHDLDELRRRLDRPLPPITPVARRSFRPGRRAALGALVIGGTLGLAATGVLVPWSDLHPTEGTGAAARPSPLTPAGPFTPAVEPSVPVSDAPAPLEAPAGALPASGPGIDRPGSAQVLTIEPDGTVLVVEQAVLGPRGQRGLALGLPSLTALGGSASGLHPGVRDLRVAVNDTPVTASADGKGGWTADTGAARARTVRLSYRLTGSVLRSRDSEPGRALVVSLPLLAQALREQGLPMIVRTTGTNVRGVTCPGAPAAEMLCATRESSGWTANIPAAATVPATLLQVDLRT